MNLEPSARDRLAAIGEIAAEIAHELQNMLQIIAANVYLARQDLPNGPAAAEPHLAKIERHTRLAQAVVNDLMALARGEAARAETLVLGRALDAAREGLPAPGAAFTDRIEPAELEIRAHDGLVARLFHALYENSVHARAPARVAILTKAWCDGDRVIVEVSDDGPGVPSAIGENLFQPLVTGRDGGSGLGLALARRIAEAHGGTLSLVASGREGECGATFRIELPR